MDIAEVLASNKLPQTLGNPTGSLQGLEAEEKCLEARTDLDRFAGCGMCLECN